MRRADTRTNTRKAASSREPAAAALVASYRLFTRIGRTKPTDAGTS
jgi:hypothetical protein